MLIDLSVELDEVNCTTKTSIFDGFNISRLHTDLPTPSIQSMTLIFKEAHSDSMLSKFGNRQRRCGVSDQRTERCRYLPCRE